MDKKILMQKAYNWIAEQDENGAIISDGDIDIASEFIAEFIQNLIDNGVLAEPTDENSGLNIPVVSGMLLSDYAKEKLEYINGSCIARDFPKEQPTKEWAGAVLDLLEDMKLGNYR